MLHIMQHAYAYVYQKVEKFQPLDNERAEIHYDLRFDAGRNARENVINLILPRAYKYIYEAGACERSGNREM